MYERTALFIKQFNALPILHLKYFTWYNRNRSWDSANATQLCFKINQIGLADVR